MKILAWMLIAIGAGFIFWARWQHFAHLPHLSEMQALQFWWKEYFFGAAGILSGATVLRWK